MARRHRNLMNVGGSSVRHHTLGHRTYTRALTPCVDGNGNTVKRTRTASGTARLAIVDTPTIVLDHVRQRDLLAPITTYISVAMRCGLDPANVAMLYRQRADNGHYATTHGTTLTTNDLAERRI